MVRALVVVRWLREMPPVKVDVPVPEELITPPVKVRPFVEARPPVPTERPPVNVEVADPNAVIVEVDVKGPVLREPVIMASPSTPSDRTGEVVPIPTRSVTVVRRTTAPSSVHPPAELEEHTPFAAVQTRESVLPSPTRSLPVISVLPAKVEVPVPCAFKRLPIVEVPLTRLCPSTENTRPGDDDATATRPFAYTKKSSPTVKSPSDVVAFPIPSPPFIYRSPSSPSFVAGDDVPMPTESDEVVSLTIVPSSVQPLLLLPHPPLADVQTLEPL